VTPTEPCQRCGTFSALSDIKGRRLCGACAQLAHHAVDETPPTLLGLGGSWFVLVRENLGLSFGAALVSTLPMAAIYWVFEPAWWVNSVYGLVVHTFSEALVVSAAWTRISSETRDLPAALARVEARYLSALGVNLVSAVAINLGMFTCVLAIVFASWLWSAIPIVLIEDVGPFTALRESFRRGRGHRWLLLGVSAAILAPTVLMSVILPTVKTLHSSGVSMSWWAEPATRATVVLLYGLYGGATQLFQLAVWAATKPRPPAGELQSTESAA
jgi:hypothetical protein